MRRPELEGVELRILEVEPQLDRPPYEAAHVGVAIPGHDMVLPRLRDRVGVVECEPFDLAVVRGEHLHAHLGRSGAGSDRRGGAVEMQLRPGEAKGARDQLAERRGGVQNAHQGFLMQPVQVGPVPGGSHPALAAVHRHESVQGANRQPDGRGGGVSQLPASAARRGGWCRGSRGGRGRRARWRSPGRRCWNRSPSPAAAADDERLPVGTLPVESVAADDDLGVVGQVGGAEDPEQADVEPGVGDDDQAIELRIGIVVRVGNEDGLRLGPVDHVGALGAADEPPAEQGPHVVAALTRRPRRSRGWGPIP